MISKITPLTYINMKGVFLMYYNRNFNPTKPPYQNNNRFFGGFAVPFLFGSLAGGAAVGLTRPRPVFVNQPYPYPRPYPYPYYYPY